MRAATPIARSGGRNQSADAAGAERRVFFARRNGFWRKRADSDRELDIHRCKICGVRTWRAPLSSAEYIWTKSALPDAKIPRSVFAREAQSATRQGFIGVLPAVHPN